MPTAVPAIHQPNLLPAVPTHARLGTTVPFGLATAEPVPEGPADLRGLRYDPHAQISLAEDGTPVSPLQAGTSTDTNEDSQWWVDKD